MVGRTQIPRGEDLDPDNGVPDSCPDMPRIPELARELVTACEREGISIACAESCTGGLLGAAITSIPGASACFWGGFVTYSNESKTALLGVDPALIESFGAVSGAVAGRMAEGTLRAAGSSVAIAITGIAGPGGGTPEKPVGTVCFALRSSRDSRGIDTTCLFHGGRERIRTSAVETALTILLSFLDADMKRRKAGDA